MQKHNLARTILTLGIFTTSIFVGSRAFCNTPPPVLPPGTQCDASCDDEQLQPTKLTLTEAVKKALDYSQSVKSAASSIKSAIEDTNKARALIFPTISGQALGSTKQNPASFTSGNASGQVGSLIGDTYALDLNLSQPLYAGGGLTAGISFYKTAEDIARQTYYNTKQTVLQTALNTFYSLANAQQSVQAAQQNVQILKEYLDITTRYARIGRARQMDKLQAQANYSLGLSDLENTRNSLVQAQANLRLLFGDTYKYAVDADFDMVIHPLDKLTVDQAFEEASKTNPTILSAKLTLEQVDYSRDMDLATDMPNAALTGQAGYESPSLDQLVGSQSTFGTIGVTLNVPLFSGLSSFAKRRQWGEKKYEAEKALQLAKDTLRNNIEDSLVALRSGRRQLILSEKSVKDAKVALKMATEGYQQGIAASTDVSNMQTTYYTAAKGLISAQFTYLENLVSLRQYMGIDLEKAYVH